MKAKFFAILVCSVMLFVAGCSDDSLPVQAVDDELTQSELLSSTVEDEEEPVVEDGIIPFTESQLEGYGIIRDRLPADTLVVINSLEEFDYYISPGEEPEPLTFDFAEKTLLVAHGWATNGIDNIAKEIVKAGDSYSLTVTITLNDTHVVPEWLICLVIDKIATDEVSFRLLKEGGTVVSGKRDTGYIVGYNGCGLELDVEQGVGKAEGYIFISEDAKDTLTIYKLPEIFSFPVELFDGYVKYKWNVNYAFDSEYAHQYKVQLKYRIVDAGEVAAEYNFCTVPAIHIIGAAFKKTAFAFVEEAVEIEEVVQF
ncbi:MAG: hypothetical protein LBS54_01055 [Dysgonamonadaceae bacterium]|jgi:hypothetical protein|nr:hypothetical protein [Dysgonamonadaceae bacterium]